MTFVDRHSAAQRYAARQLARARLWRWLLLAVVVACALWPLLLWVRP